MFFDMVKKIGFEGVSMLFKIPVAEAKKWTAETKKEWLRNYKRGLITFEDTFRPDEIEEAKKEVSTWS